jgi:hypothetical protein
MLQPKKPVVKKTTTKKTKTVSQRIGDTTLRDVKNAGEDALQIVTLGGYGKVKKALGGEYKHKKIGERKNGGKVTKAKNGKSFPDLNKDGKVTKADILKGRGVIAKKGATVKKAQDGYTGKPGLLERTGPMLKTKVKERSDDGNYVKKTVTRTRKGATTKSTKTRRSLQGFLQGAPRVSELKNGGKMKSGGSMKKCKGGC